MLSLRGCATALVVSGSLLLFGCSSSSTSHGTKHDLGGAMDMPIAVPDMASTIDQATPPDLGSITIGGLTLDTQALNWQPNCGTASGGAGLGTQTVTLTNSTSAAITIGVQFGSGATSADGFTVSPSDASQMVPASGSALVIDARAAGHWQRQRHPAPSSTRW